MSITNICTDATDDGYYPDENGISAPASSFAVVGSGPFGNARVNIEVIAGGDWVDVEDGEKSTAFTGRLNPGPDMNIRFKISGADATTSITIDIN